jgi:hypothetical protein
MSIVLRLSTLACFVLALIDVLSDFGMPIWPVLLCLGWQCYELDQLNEQNRELQGTVDRLEEWISQQ